jgi:hypothetical protein
MRPWDISITHRCVPWGEGWEADVRQAFAAVGWTVTSIGPTGSSTHVEEDYLALTSSSKEFDPAVLMDVLSQLGVHRVDFIEQDGDRFTTRSWTAVIDERWWNRCTDPRALLREAVPRSAPDGSHTFKNYENWNRKFWLCACAAGRFCTRRFKGRVSPVFDALERFADGTASETELCAARDTHLANDPQDPWPFASPVSPYPYPFEDKDISGSPSFVFCKHADSFACAIVCQAFDELRQIPVNTSPEGGRFTPQDPAEFERLTTAAKAALVPLVRDILGNPFRPVSLDPTWLTWRGGLVVSMTQRMYNSRDFTDMPILADPLEEAGCQDQDILAHCRSGGEHVKGCWVVDLLLGKT